MERGEVAVKLPEYVKNCISELESAGFSAYAVGGAVRDGLLGLEPSDFDVTTNALPDETLAVFSHRRCIPTGIKHGTVTVLFENGEIFSPIEITTFRIDGEYRDSRHPESVFFSKNILDDLSRRDFTVNAMAYNERDGIIDAHGGMLDLERRLIRAVGNPEKRFCEDALRILRAFRFAAQLEFEIESETLSAAQKCAPLLKNIARERIGAEFKKLLSSRGVTYALEKMIKCDIWSNIFAFHAPELDKVRVISTLRSANPFARLCIMLDGAPDDEISTFLDGLRLSNDEKKLVLRLMKVKNFAVPPAADKTVTAPDLIGDTTTVEASRNSAHRAPNPHPTAANSAAARQFLHLYGNVLPLAIEILRLYNPDASDFLHAIETESAQKRPLSISDLDVNGNDILPLCRGNHKRVGALLNILLGFVIEDPTLNEKNKLIEIAKKSLE